MAHFYSDLVNWTTAGAIGAAVFLSGVELLPAGHSRDVDEPQAELLVASADISAISPAIVSRVETALADVGFDDGIKAATLKEVEFTEIGLDRSSLIPAEPQRAVGVVTGSSVNIRSGAGTGNPVVARGTQGQEFPVTGRSDGIWVEILVPGGRTAWIHGRYFQADTQIASAQ